MMFRYRSVSARGAAVQRHVQHTSEDCDACLRARGLERCRGAKPLRLRPPPR